MSKTFDLSTLNLSAGTHEITVKARANGYADSVASNAVSYVVAGEETYTLRGTYLLNDKIYMKNDVHFDVQFSSRGNNYSSIAINGVNIEYDGVSQTLGFDENGYSIWKIQDYRTISFNGTQTVSKEFYDWLNANAEKISDKEYVWLHDNDLGNRKIRSDFNIRRLAECGNVLLTFTTFVSPDAYTSIHLVQLSESSGVANGVPYVGGRFELMYDADIPIKITAYDNANVEGDFYDEVYGTWEKQEYRTLIINEPQYVPIDFYEWLMLNTVIVADWDSDIDNSGELPNNRG
jgi:hypothetical protein